MKQIVQNIGNGNTDLITVPAPICGDYEVLIKVASSLISAGTEKMLIEFGKSFLISKARSQPERVAQVLSKIKTDGLVATYESVTAKLNQPLALGYSNAGTVIQVGREVRNFKVGDRVASNGKHAEFVAVPENLCAKIPDSVSFEEASFTSVAAIALQSIRLAKVNIGESVAVIGLGLIGLIVVQILRANGCKVVGIDLDEAKLDYGLNYGAVVFKANQDGLIDNCLNLTNGQGFDSVIIAASTSSNDPITLAAQISKQRGKVILVGVVGLELNRADYYKKELSFQVSCSYGPGRYDGNYEDRSQDYPFGFVRWTAQRNFSAVLSLIEDHRIDVKSLITHRFDLNQFDLAYKAIVDDEFNLAVILNYSNQSSHEQRILNQSFNPTTNNTVTNPVIAIVGAGNYSSRILSRAFVKTNVKIKYVSSASGLSGSILGRRINSEYLTSGLDSLLNDDEVNCLVIATRHNEHCSNILAGLQSNKHVFVEKPLCLTIEQLEQIIAAKSKAPNLSLMIGFNRRFSVFSQRLKSILSKITAPKSIVITVNAGSIPADHWTQDVAVGGGRIIGEACHFIDLMRFFVGCEITEVKSLASLSPESRGNSYDTVSISLGFRDGSHGVIHYFANGHRSYPKERIEVFTSGKIFIIDNFRKLSAFGQKGFKKMSRFKQDKGQDLCVASFMESVIKGTPSPIPFDEICEVTRVSIEIDHSLRNG